HFKKCPPGGDCSRSFRGQWTTRFFFLSYRQLVGEQFSKLESDAISLIFYKENVWREAPQLIPRHHVCRGLCHNLLRTPTGERGVGDVSKADSMAIANETDVPRQSRVDGIERFITASGGDAL